MKDYFLGALFGALLAIPLALAMAQSERYQHDYFHRDDPPCRCQETP